MIQDDSSTMFDVIRKESRRGLGVGADFFSIQDGKFVFSNPTNANFSEGSLEVFFINYSEKGLCCFINDQHFDLRVDETCAFPGVNERHLFYSIKWVKQEDGVQTFGLERKPFMEL